MRTTLTVTSPPAGEPVTIEMVKLHCRIDHDADDLLLAGYLTAARVMAEDYLSRKLLTQTLLWTVRPTSSFGLGTRLAHGPLVLPRAPVQSIASVTLVDAWGNSTAVQPAALPLAAGTAILGYVADLSLEPSILLIGRETILSGGLPVHATRLQHVQVSMVAGYGAAAAVPPTIAQAVMMTTAFLYEHRGDTEAAMPAAAEWLLNRDRLQFLGG